MFKQLPGNPSSRDFVDTVWISAVSAFLILGGRWLRESVPAYQEMHWVLQALIPVALMASVPAIRYIVRKQRESENPYRTSAPGDDQIR